MNRRCVFLFTCYDYGGKMYFFTNKKGWENVLQEVEENVKLYLKKEESSIFKKIRWNWSWFC